MKKTQTYTLRILSGIFAVLTAVILFTGCSKNEISHDAFFDTFLLTDMQVDGISIPAVFNPAKGTTTPLCTDPLCDHTEKAGCPFAGYNITWEPHYYNGSIWFLSMTVFGKLDEFAVMRYDMDTAKVTELIRMEALREHIVLVVLMMFWMLMRTFRLTVFYYVFPIGQWCWYAYYISMILIPQICLFAAKYIGKPEDYRLSKKWSWMYVPSIILVLGILTNDLHQLAFRFHLGYEIGWQKTATIRA